jgi:hypothetical protein
VAKKILKPLKYNDSICRGAEVRLAAEAGALSAWFAHEVAQPLTTIALNVEAMERLLGGDRPEKLKVGLADIRQAAQHATEVIQHITEAGAKSIFTSSTLTWSSPMQRASFLPMREEEGLPFAQLASSNHCWYERMQSTYCR